MVRDNNYISRRKQADLFSVSAGNSASKDSAKTLPDDVQSYLDTSLGRGWSIFSDVGLTVAEKLASMHFVLLMIFENSTIVESSLSVSVVTGYIQHFTLKLHFLLDNFILFRFNFILREIIFPLCLINMYNFVQKL